MKRRTADGGCRFIGRGEAAANLSSSKTIRRKPKPRIRGTHLHLILSKSGEELVRVQVVKHAEIWGKCGAAYVSLIAALSPTGDSQIDNP